MGLPLFSIAVNYAVILNQVRQSSAFNNGINEFFTF